MPVVIALTKWDLVGGNGNQAREATLAVLGGLIDAVRGTRHLYGALIPVACGREPMNVILPVLWCLHVGIAIRGVQLQESIYYHQQVSEAAMHMGGWRDDLRSWWRGQKNLRYVGALAQKKVQDDLLSLLPLVKPSQELERLLESVEKF